MFSLVHPTLLGFTIAFAIWVFINGIENRRSHGTSGYLGVAMVSGAGIIVGVAISLFLEGWWAVAAPTVCGIAAPFVLIATYNCYYKLLSKE